MQEPSYFKASTGETIAFRWYGDSAATETVLYFHGFPGSNLEGSIATAGARKKGLRILAFDRPGYGASDGDTRATIGDVARNAAELLAHHHVRRVTLLAISGGAPYVLCLAASRPELVVRTVIVSGVGPIHQMHHEGAAWHRGMVTANTLLLHLGLHVPKLGTAVTALIARLWKCSPPFALLWLKAILSASDVAILGRLHVKKLMLANLREALKSGVEGATRDFMCLVKPWGFELDAIEGEVILLHGDADRYVPPTHAEFLRAKIKSSSLEILSGGGHFVAFDVVDKVVDRFFPALRSP